MDDEKSFQGNNFHGFHAGPKEHWGEYKAVRPEVPVPTRGKMFLRKHLDSRGLEMSLNVVLPGTGATFLHRHQQNDELYVVIGGVGQFVIDGEVINVQEGSVIRMSPPAARAYRNHSDEPFYFLCIQYPADSNVTGGTSDGMFVEGQPQWPER